MLLIPIDFEYNNSKEKVLNLVSCAMANKDHVSSYWLHKNGGFKEQLKQELLALKDTAIFVSFAVTAEARSFMALGLDPLEFKWIDLYLEYRCLTNHNHRLMYGRQLMDGKIKFTKPPKSKYDRNEEENEEANNSKPHHGLASAVFKLLDINIDTDEKDAVRDLILSLPERFNDLERNRVINYNESDIKYLIPLLEAMIAEYKRLLPAHEIKTLKDEMLLRSQYAVRTAIMEQTGYPFDYSATRHFSSSVPSLLFKVQKEINSFFPDIAPFNYKNYKFSWSHIRTREWIATTPHKDKWMLTDGGKKGIKEFSLKLDAFKKFYNFRHDFPEDNFGAQMVRYLGLQQNLNGFKPSKNSKSVFWDYVGSDQRVRPYFGIYGSQSARSQPKATGFLFLKSAWMRSLCMPRKGRAIAGIDYSSQEFLIAALISKDSTMLKAYLSGDPYMYLAKLAGEIPLDGKREDYEKERNVFKVVTLALQFGMGAESLANDLNNKLGLTYTKAQAQKLIDIFNSKYRDYYRYKGKVVNQYKRDKYLKLPCGWVMFGDNSSNLSAGNFPIQGFGSSVMRKAVEFAQDAGLEVIKTLHDAIYIEYDSGDFSKIEILADCMFRGFQYYWPDKIKKYAKIRLEANTWSPDYEDGYQELGDMPLKIQNKYLDKRGMKEYLKFKEYLEPQEFDI